MDNIDRFLSDPKNRALVEQALVYETERKRNFKTADPKKCEHKLVYCKDGDNYHCNNCDMFMYDASKN